jgi:hypothetical protein
MKNIISTSCAALLAIASAAPSFAEIRTAPGEWRPDSAAALEQLYDCDPNKWTRAISDATGETLYSNNWTCKPGRASARGGDRCPDYPEKAIIKYGQINKKCYYPPFYPPF